MENNYDRYHVNKKIYLQMNNMLNNVGLEGGAKKHNKSQNNKEKQFDLISYLNTASIEDIEKSVEYYLLMKDIVMKF